MTRTAHRIPWSDPQAAGDMRLYRLSHPLDGHHYVVVSAVVPMFSNEPETFIFGSGPDGRTTNWLELTGSFRGALDHDAALRNAGYDVFVPEAS